MKTPHAGTCTVSVDRKTIVFHVPSDSENLFCLFFGALPLLRIVVGVFLWRDCYTPYGSITATCTWLCCKLCAVDRSYDDDVIDDE